MHIGIDLDNTLLDATSSHLKYFNEASGLSFTPEDVNDFHIYRLYGWDDDERDRIYHKYGQLIHKDASPFPEAIEVVNRFFHIHEITIITARPERFLKVTVDWLKHYHIHYHGIIFTEDKLKVCKESKIDILIDDKPHYAEEFSSANKPVILYDQPYNQSIQINSLIYRAFDWMDVKKVIQRLENESNGGNSTDLF